LKIILVAVPPLLFQFCDVATSSSVIIPVILSM